MYPKTLARAYIPIAWNNDPTSSVSTMLPAITLAIPTGAVLYEIKLNSLSKSRVRKESVKSVSSIHLSVRSVRSIGSSVQSVRPFNPSVRSIRPSVQSVRPLNRSVRSMRPSVQSIRPFNTSVCSIHPSVQSVHQLKKNQYENP